MVPEIVIVPERKLAGKRLVMNFAANRTAELWRSFMPVRHEINGVGSELFSAAVYPDGFFTRFDPTADFEKWATAAVSPTEIVPDGLETLVIPAGKYAVFHYKGSSEQAPDVFRYIFNEWLPGSGYQIDNRPHFEILGEKYKNADADSEEDIYIPIRQVNE
jgi:AraC family transcriptional regulator